MLYGYLWFIVENEWIQLDIGSPSLVTALITKGRGDTGRKQWVTRYRVSYSNDSLVWQFYEDKFNLEEVSKQVFVTKTVRFELVYLFELFFL